MRIDVNSFVGAYPFRRVPHTSPDAVLRSMDRCGIDEAWISHLPGVFWRAPADGNEFLYQVTSAGGGGRGGGGRLQPVPAVHPGLSGWGAVLAEAAGRGAPAVRCDPTFHAIDPAGSEMRALAAACGGARLPLLLSVRLEDSRQRHPRDTAPDMPAAAVRALVRSHPSLRLIVTHADRSFIEEVHFGSTPAEATRMWWDICWIWGPPEDHLQTLLGTVGVDRFVFGTGQPLRIPETSLAKLDLLDLTSNERAAIESGNVTVLRS